MKRIILLSLLLVSMSANAASVLVEYVNGNQIFGSDLTIFSDGTVHHGERSCCPPHTDLVPEKRLSSSDLQNLNTWIAAAALGRIQTRNGRPTAAGSQSGALVAYRGKTQVGIYEVKRAQVVGDPDKISYNPTLEAGLVKKMIERYVKNPFP